jgi:hypothetical protein
MSRQLRVENVAEYRSLDGHLELIAKATVDDIIDIVADAKLQADGRRPKQARLALFP